MHALPLLAYFFPLPIRFGSNSASGVPQASSPTSTSFPSGKVYLRTSLS